MDGAALKKEARNKKTTSKRLLELAHIADAGVQLAVAGNKNAPPDALEYLGGHGRYSILKALAKNPSTPDVVLERLARHKRLSVREALIEHPGLPPKALEVMAADLELIGYWLVFKQRAGFAAAPRAIEAILSSADPGRRAGLAEHVALSPKAVALGAPQRLLDDPDPLVRASLVRNLSLPVADAEGLLHHEDAATRAIAVRLGEWDQFQLERLMPDPSAEVRAAIARYPGVQLERLASDPEPLVRVAVAQRFHALPAALLARLARDLEDFVRAAVATHHQELVGALLTDLACDASEIVRFCVACNHRTPKAVLEALARDRAPNRFLLAEDTFWKIPAQHLTIAERATEHLRQRRQPNQVESFPQPDLNTLFRVSSS